MKAYLNKKAETFFQLWQLDIVVEDNRSEAMPQMHHGKVVGIKEDAVLIRVGNVITSWFPFSNTNLKFYIPENKNDN